jgi:hypothetical protein
MRNFSAFVFREAQRIGKKNDQLPAACCGTAVRGEPRAWPRRCPVCATRVGQPARELHLHRVGDQLELERSTRVDLRPGTGLAARIESIGQRPGPSCCRRCRVQGPKPTRPNTIDPAVLINAQLRGSPCAHLTGQARAAAAVSFSARAQDGVSRPLPPSRPGSRPSSFASPCLGVLSQ